VAELVVVIAAAAVAGLLTTELLDLEILLGKLDLKVGNAVLEFLVGTTELGLALWSLIDGLDLSNLESRLLGGNEATLERDEDGLTGLASEPLVGLDSGSGAGSWWVDVVLEELGLAGHLERDGLDVADAGLEESDDFALGDIDGGLGAEGHAELRSRRLVLGDEVDDLGVLHNLVVADVTVTLASEEEQAGVVIVEGHQDTRGGIDGREVQWVGGGTGIPDGELTVGRLAEADGDKEFAVAQEGAARALDSLVSNNVVRDGTGSWVEDAVLLVLASGTEHAAVAVPRGARDDVGVAADGELGITGRDIPDLDSEVGRRRGDDVVGSGVEVDGTDLSAMANEVLGRIVHRRLAETTLGDHPDATVAILRHRTNNAVVEGVEVDIEHSSLVARNETLVSGHLAELSVGQHCERASTTGLPHNTGVGTVALDLVRVPSALGNLDVVIGELLLVGSTENVSVLGLTDNARHDVCMWCVFYNSSMPMIQAHTQCTY
jgi:hypothetical protein